MKRTNQRARWAIMAAICGAIILGAAGLLAWLGGPREAVLIEIPVQQQDWRQ